MLEYKREDEARLIQNIILGFQDLLGFSCLFIPSLESRENINPFHVLPLELKPKGVVVNMIPGLPAYILFMCIRHADYLSDEAKLKSLMNAVIGAVKQVISVRLNLRYLDGRGVEGGESETGLLVSEFPERR